MGADADRGGHFDWKYLKYKSRRSLFSAAAFFQSTCASLISLSSGFPAGAFTSLRADHDLMTFAINCWPFCDNRYVAKARPLSALVLPFTSASGAGAMIV